MQSGIDTSRLRIAGEEFATNISNITKIDITPDKLGATAANTKGFFNEGGPSFRDVLDAVNPLNHIPIVSTIYQRAVGHQPSTASNLAGGALLGGPIGFMASLASEIFTSAIGVGPMESAYAAITGDGAQQVAQVAANVPEQLASLDVDTDPAALAALSPASAIAAPVEKVTQAVVAPAMKAGANPVLDLYGASSSAHDSYKKAQLLPYLREVNTSKVL